MNYALISPKESAFYISGWENGKPVLSSIGSRIAQCSETQFPVADPLFWVQCSEDVKAETHYYDLDSQTFLAKPADAILPIEPITVPPGTPDPAIGNV